jgi:hypothetical protein
LAWPALVLIAGRVPCKTDIQFWRTRKSVEGLSVRSIFINLFFQTVILLYLFDNDTSWTILIRHVVGLLIRLALALHLSP